MKIILSVDDVIEFLEKGNPNVVKKVRDVTFDIIAALMDTDEIKDATEKIINNLVTGKVKEVLRDAIKVSTWNNRDATGWGVTFLKAEMSKKLDGVDVSKIIHEEVKKNFDYYTRETIKETVKEELRESINGMLTNEGIEKAAVKAVKERLTAGQ